MNRSALFYIRTISIVVIIVLVIGYSFFSARHILEGPRLIIEKPINGEVFTDGLMTLEGSALNISYISLNDRAIYIDEQGKFKEKLLLSPGYNIIKMYARDKFDREVTKHLEVVLNEAYTFAIPTTTPASTSSLPQASSSPIIE